MVCYTWFVIFASLIPIVVCNLELLTNINDVILSDAKVLQEKENKQEFLKLLVDRLESNDHVEENDVVGKFGIACGNPLNRSVCMQSLNRQCGDIPALLKTVIEQNSAEIKTTDLFPAIVFYESTEDCSERTGSLEVKRVKPTTAQDMSFILWPLQEEDVFINYLYTINYGCTEYATRDFNLKIVCNPRVIGTLAVQPISYTPKSYENYGNYTFPHTLNRTLAKSLTQS